MAVFMVTWNINNERSNYSHARRVFLEHLERYPNIKDPALESVRWISSTATASQVYDDLRIKLDSNDRIFITQVGPGSYYGYLDKAVWDWIAARA